MSDNRFLHVNVLGLANQMSGMLTKQNLHVVHIVRNPFEMTVSEYTYDLADSESWWMEQPMYNCNPQEVGELFCSGIGDVATKATPGASQHGSLAGCTLTHLLLVVPSSVGGSLHGVLPTPECNTTWLSYLTALPEDAGLLATAVLSETRPGFSPLHNLYTHAQGSRVPRVAPLHTRLSRSPERPHPAPSQ